MSHENEPSCTKADVPPTRFDRRAFLVGGSLAAAGVIGYPLIRRLWRPPKPVFLARNQRYDGPLAQTIRDGLKAVGFDPSWLPGRRVLLKPNLVEPTRLSPQMTTHPAVILAAAEVFRRWGAEVLVGEGPGHVRDTEMALVSSGLEEALHTAKLEFADFNYGEARSVANAGRTSSLESFFLPVAALEADLIVSMPKLKTHHWVGVTAAMKNLYGLLPGSVYGWPKNVLHHAGIPQTVVDVNATVPRTIAIVDAILCMEGDGPIMGTAKPMGLLAIGQNLTAVDATCARIMGFEPRRVTYLALAENRLGPVADRDIVQRGEPWQELVEPFKILDLPHLRGLTVDG